MSKCKFSFHKKDLKKIMEIMEHFEEDTVTLSVDQSSGIGCNITCEVDYYDLGLKHSDKATVVIPISDEEDW